MQWGAILTLDVWIMHNGTPSLWATKVTSKCYGVPLTDGNKAFSLYPLLLLMLNPDVTVYINLNSIFNGCFIFLSEMPLDQMHVYFTWANAKHVREFCVSFP